MKLFGEERRVREVWANQDGSEVDQKGTTCVLTSTCLALWLNESKTLQAAWQLASFLKYAFVLETFEVCVVQYFIINDDGAVFLSETRGCTP